MGESTSVATNRIAAVPDTSQFLREERDEQITLIDVLVILTARRRLVAAVLVATVIISVILAFLLPAEYTAHTTIIPPQQNSSLTTALTAQLSNLGTMGALAGSSLGLKNPNEMYVAMLQSQVVEDAVIERFQLMREYDCKFLSQARKTFEKHFTIQATGKDGLIHILVEDKDPRRAAEMANGYVEEFRKLSKTLAITEASQRRVFFQQQLEQAKDQLADAEEALKQTEQQTGMIQLDSQTRALIASAANLRAQIAEQEVQVQTMRTYATSENAKLIQAEQELQGLRNQLAKLGGSEDDSGAELIAPKGVVPQSQLIYMRRLRDVKYSETLFEILARQFELAKLDEAKEGALIQTLDPALVPDRRSSPKRLLILAGGLFFGLFLGISAALFQALLERLRANPETDAKLNFIRSSFTAHTPKPTRVS